MAKAKEETTRWNLKVSRQADLAVRTFLGSQGMKKGDLSKFIQEAACWRVLNRTVQDIKGRNVSIDPDELQRLVDEAVSEVRAERRSERKG